MNIFDNLLTWLIFGSVVGSLGYIFDEHVHSAKGLIIPGILGAMLGGVLANVILNIPLEQFSLVSFMVALCIALFFVVGSINLRKT